MPDFATPMMQQYVELKKQYADCLLLFRLGDFYELFMEDAKIGAKILNITLTSRDRGKDGRIPMAGVPYHALDVYLNKLVRAGYKVAICEQLSEPQSGELVVRDVVRIVTPGTILDENSLEKKENNFIATFSFDDSCLGLAYADVSTGVFYATELTFLKFEPTLLNELFKFNPAECILPHNYYNQPKLLNLLLTTRTLNVSPFDQWVHFADDGSAYLKNHFNIASLHGFGLEGLPHAIKASAALLGYLKHTQKDKIGHIKKIVKLSQDDFVELDRSTIFNLELLTTIRQGDKHGSFINYLDKTITSAGGRKLKQWVLKPLRSIEQINKRLDSVEVFIKDIPLRAQITDKLATIFDIERLLSRLSVGIGNARDLVNLKQSLNALLEIRVIIAKSNDSLIRECCENITLAIDSVVEIIAKTIEDNPPIDVKIGGLIKTGVNLELDNLKQRVLHSKDWISSLELTEKKRTGISSLKIRFNQVFGYYIEITKSNIDAVPDNYIRKQTLVNTERFITPELKEQEEFILSADEKIKTIEYDMFLNTVASVLKYTFDIQKAADAIATLDCLLNFVAFAETYGYCRPVISDDNQINIKDSRHPVVEELLVDTQFVPNDVCLDSTAHQLLIITGPNMAGKSVFIRQVALIVLMAQIGCFVPASEAHIGVVDQIFVRSGAADVITAGLSTFMVEMVETANILNNATSNSLIVMDEIGRGTSTYDGISIAWAIAEYLVQGSITPKTLFATHYHELTELEAKYPKRIKNFQVVVKENNGMPIFLHKVMEGGASHSFGIAVANMAGIPTPVIKSATKLLHDLEAHRNVSGVATEGDLSEAELQSIQRSLENVTSATEASEALTKVFLELQNLDLDNTTPIAALQKLLELKAICQK